jgi:hypothetical protein
MFQYLRFHDDENMNKNKPWSRDDVRSIPKLDYLLVRLVE